MGKPTISDGKCADIKLIDPETKDSIFIEVSQLSLSKRQVEIQNQHRKITDAFVLNGYSVLGAFKQLHYLVEPQLEALLQRIIEMKNLAAHHQQFLCYEDHAIIMAVAHPSRLQELDQWCNTKKIQRNSVTGAPQDYNDTYRLVENQKISKEIKQLSKGHAGLVYIPVSPLYFYMMDLWETMLSIMDLLDSFPECIGVTLYSESVGTLLSMRDITIKNTKFVVSELHGLTRHVLYVNNPNFTGDLSEKTFKRFKQCLH